MKKLVGATALSLALITTLVAATGRSDEAVHFGLRTSSPEAGASVTSPSEIRLRFTEAPQEGTTSIRLVEAEEAGVHVMDVAADPEDDTSYFVMIHGTLPPRTYTVSWRGMGADGHVVRDSFEFTVVAN